MQTAKVIEGTEEAALRLSAELGLRSMVRERLTVGDIKAFLADCPDSAILRIAFEGIASGIELTNQGAFVYIYSQSRVEHCET